MISKTSVCCGTASSRPLCLRQTWARSHRSRPTSCSSGMPSGSQLFQSDSDASLASSVATISIRAVSAASAQQAQDFRALTRAYLEWLGEDLGFQGIERELASLPGSYAADQGGHMLLAYECAAGGGGEEECVGAVALRRLAGHTDTLQPGQAVARVPLEKVCEMKRLFVLPGHHGRQVGRQLVQRLMEEGAALGYELMVLDTLERLTGANRLYASLGFQPIERYNSCPLPGVLYFGRRLGGAAS